MAWTQGWDFRATGAYVTDPADTASVLAADSGWDATADLIMRDRDSGVDARLAGIAANDNTVRTWSYTLPSAGDYIVDLAAGDATNAQGSMRLYIKDNTTTLLSITAAGTGAAEFVDATNVKRTSVADWIANHATQVVTFATTSLKVVFGDGATGNGTLAHLKLTKVESTAAPVGAFDPPFNAGPIAAGFIR